VKYKGQSKRKEVLVYFNSDVGSIKKCVSYKDINIPTITRVYPKVSALAAWSKNCKWYSSLPLDAVVSLFCEPVY
jgi:hypothetical protein